MADVKLSDILAHEKHRRHATLTRRLDEMIEELQDAQRKLETLDRRPTYVTSNILRDAGEVFRLATEYNAYLDMHALALKEGQ